MPKLVVHGAMLQCTMGVAPGTLSVLPAGRVEGDAKPVATVMDFAPMVNVAPVVNVAPFGACKSAANTLVAAATAAAMGVLAPMPCVPVIPAPWMPGAPTATIGVFPALTESSQCMCAWAGQISVTMPGATQFTVG